MRQGLKIKLSAKRWASAFIHPKTVFSIIVCILFSTALPRLSLAEDSELAELQELDKNYLFITTHSNYPIAKSLSFLRSGGYGNGGQFMHTLNRNWVMSVGMHFKNFEDLGTGKLRSMATGYHETLAIVRMYYPAYLFVGIQGLYLLPSLSNSLPPKRDPILDAEVGFGLCAYIFSRLGENYAGYLKVSRWRGTKTTRLQAYEVSVGLGRSF